MSSFTKNNNKIKTLLLPLCFMLCLFYSCKDEPDKQVIDPNNLYRFILKDENPNSISFNSNIGPALYKGKVSVYYFGDPG